MNTFYIRQSVWKKLVDNYPYITDCIKQRTLKAFMAMMSKLERMKKEDVAKHIKRGEEYQVRFVDYNDIK